MDFQGLYFFDIHIPKPSKNIKFQPPGVFLVAKGHKFHTLGGFRYIKRHDCIKKNPFRTRILHNKKWLPLGWIRSPSCVCTYLNPPSGCEICAPQKTHQKADPWAEIWYSWRVYRYGKFTLWRTASYFAPDFWQKSCRKSGQQVDQKNGQTLFFIAVVNSMGKNHMNKSQNFWTRFLDPTYKQTTLYTWPLLLDLDLSFDCTFACSCQNVPPEESSFANGVMRKFRLQILPLLGSPLGQTALMGLGSDTGGHIFKWGCLTQSNSL